MYVIGLTGNIASGKSAVAQMLATLGAYSLDADKLAHWVMRKGTDAYARIVHRFGAAMVGLDGEIDRSKLGPVAFGDPKAMRDLEAIVHPFVLAETLRRLAASDAAVAVVEAIKLLEAHMHLHCDSVWVVVCPCSQQLERLQRTRRLTEQEARLRVDAQASVVHKVGHARVVIDNGGTLQETWRQVLRAWNAIPGAERVALDSPWIEQEGEQI